MLERHAIVMAVERKLELEENDIRSGRQWAYGFFSAGFGFFVLTGVLMVTNSAVPEWIPGLAGALVSSGAVPFLLKNLDKKDKINNLKVSKEIVEKHKDLTLQEMQEVLHFVKG